MAKAKMIIDKDFKSFQRTPCQIQTGFSLTLRTYAVFPIKVGDKVSAGITYDRYIQFLYQFQYIKMWIYNLSPIAIGITAAAVKCPYG